MSQPYAGTISSIDESPSERTRDEARNLAHSIADRARAGTDPFELLVRQYSEDADRIADGDIGLWSSSAPGDKPREIKASDRIQEDLGLDSLAVMELASDVESRFGVSIPSEMYDRIQTVEDLARAVLTLEGAVTR